MELGIVIKYLRSMSLSIVIMLLLVYGMATQNPLLQPMYIILSMLTLQIVYQMIKTTRSRGIVEENLRESARVKRGRILFKASVEDVKRARERGKSAGELSLGSKMFITLLIPLAIFIITGYILSFYGVEQWKSYLIAFILSTPTTMIINIKLGSVPGMMPTTPNSYIVGDRGVAFDHMGQSFVLRFPLTKLSVQKEKNLIEIEGKSETQVIPSKLRLFTDKINQLNKILSKYLTDK